MTSYCCSNNHMKREHTVVAERALGHKLPPKARVHHVNGDGRDNRHRNLVICQDDAYHQLLHVHQRVRAASGDPFSQRICCVCKQLKDFSAFYLRRRGACRECSISEHGRWQRENRDAYNAQQREYRARRKAAGNPIRKAQA